jgi:hypothetical protein
VCPSMCVVQIVYLKGLLRKLFNKGTSLYRMRFRSKSMAVRTCHLEQVPSLQFMHSRRTITVP